MKITRDNVGNAILNNGRHRVMLSAEVVEAIGAQVYAASPPSEIEGRMVVVTLPPVKVAIRPGLEPTHTEPGPMWRYLTPAGGILTPDDSFDEAFMRNQGLGWCGQALGYAFPDLHSPPGPATRNHIQERIEAVLVADGWEIRDAAEEWEARQQAMAEARKAAKTAFADYSVEKLGDVGDRAVALKQERVDALCPVRK